VAVEAQHADGEVAAGGECSWAVALVRLGPVLVVGDVADVVDAVLDSPVAADETVELPGGSEAGGEAGEVVRGLGGDELVVEGGAFAGDAHDLCGVGEQAGRRRRGGGPAVIETAVAPVGGLVLRGKRTLRGGP